MARTARRRAGAVLAVVAAGCGIAGSQALARPRELTVRAGHVIVTAVPGFAPRAAVTERFDTATVGVALANRHGTVHVRLRAPRQPGTHQLLLIGAPPVDASASPDLARAGSGDQQAIVALVPRVVTVPVRVLPAQGVAGVADGPRNDRPGAGEPGHGVLGVNHGPSSGAEPADTGTDLRPWVWSGVGLLLLGAALASVRRRARHR